MDGSDIYPIIDGKKSDGWWICEGESYEKSSLRKEKTHCSSLPVSEKEDITQSMNKPGQTLSVNTTIKQEFSELVEKQGFRSLNNFATKAGIVTSNLYTNLRGDFRISLESAFQIANTLGVPIIDVLEIFCKEDMTKNRETVRSHNVSSACANDTSTDGVIDPLLWR